jgi:diguanylate cyclase (GGDEF)-like protein
MVLAGSNTAVAATPAPVLSAARRVQHPVLLVLVGAAATTVTAFHASVAAANTVWASGIGYLAFSVTLICCAAAIGTRALAAQGSLRIRWSLVAAATLAWGLGYLPSFAEADLHLAPMRRLPTACFTAGEAGYLLAAVLFFAGVGRSIAIVDTLQALLFLLLRFNLTWSPFTRDHFTIDHLLIGQVVALFMLLVALVACLGAASRGELRFLRTLAVLFGLHLVMLFLSNQVSYLWLHYRNCSLWDVPDDVIISAFALSLLVARGSARSAASDAATPLPPRSVTVRSLMPSFLALGNLMLSLFVLRISVPLAAAAISLSLICYVVRTSLLHTQAVAEKEQLRTRNEHLEGLAVRDPLTGIGNRRSLAGVYNALHASAADAPLSLLLMDVDCFKQANDSHGHLYGDRVLVVLAKMLEALAARIPGSHCARLGGDEFAVLLPGVAAHDAATLAEDLRASFGAYAFGADHSSVSLSIGAAPLRQARDLPLETLVCYADQALYRAKLLGRDRVEAQPAWEPGFTTPDPSTSSLRLELQHSS